MKGFFEFNIRKKKVTPRTEQTDSYLFVKYFSKYQNEVLFSNRSGAVKSKIKRAKIIKSFKTSKELQNSSSWRILLSNKMKSITTLNSNHDCAEQLAGKARFFLNLKSIQIFLPDLISGPAELAEERAEYVNQVFRNMRFLKRLRHLQVTPISKATNCYFLKLNGSPTLLSSLKSFKVGFDWRQTADSEVSEQIESNKNLLKNASSLSLGPLYLPIHFESFQILKELCPKITGLHFEMSCKMILKKFLPSRYSDQRLETSFNYLENLSAFRDLKTLHIDVADTFTFLKDLTLPSSLQTLQLNFIENLTKEILLKIDKNFVDSEEEELQRFFERNDLLLRFYENFKGHENLKTLAIDFSSDTDAEAYKYRSFLSQSWLKRTPSSLKNLKLLTTANSWGFNQCRSLSEVQDSYLPNILESCQNFAPTLKTIEIGSPRTVFKKFDLSAVHNKFTDLSSMKISGRFIQVQDSDIDTMGLFLKQAISIGGDSLNHLELEASIKPRTEPLLSLLRQVSQLQRPKKLRIELKFAFWVERKDLNLSENNLAEGINELKNNNSKVHGVSVEFRFLPRNAAYEEFLRLYREKFDNFWEE